MYDYFSDMSYGGTLIAGKVFGWHTIPVSLRQFRNTFQRDQAVLDCANAAAASGVDLQPYDNLIAIWNVPLDYGFGGSGVFHVGGILQAHGLVDLEMTSWNSAIAGEEMAHAYGLGHSRITSNPTVDYLDRWDVMSAVSNTFAGPGGVGPGLNAVNLNILGWLPPRKVRQLRADWQTPGTIVVTLGALPRPEAGQYVALNIIGRDLTSYFIELRAKEAWDIGIPASAVFVHKAVSGDPHSYLIDFPNSGGAAKSQGSSFWLEDGVKVTVQQIDDGTKSATVAACFGTTSDCGP